MKQRDETITNHLTSTIKSNNMPSKSEVFPSISIRSNGNQSATESRWFCDYCNLAFESYEHTCSHESSCPNNRININISTVQGQSGQGHGQGQLQGSGGGDSASQALTAAVAVARAASEHGPSLRYQNNSQMPSLALPSDREIISELDYILLRNVELFSASNEDVRESTYSDASCGSASLVGQVGMRCVHCTHSPLATAGLATVFPGSVGSIGKTLRMMGNWHFKRCGMVPSNVREDIERVFDESQTQKEKDAFALEEFCVNVLTNRMGITNMFPAKTGVIWKHHRDIESAQLLQQEDYKETRIAPDYHHTRGSSASSMTPFHYHNPLPLKSHSAPASSNSVSQYHYPHHQSLMARTSLMPNAHTPYPNPYSSSPYHYPHHHYDTSHGFIRDSMGWSCRYCNTIPFHYRSPGSVSSTLEPPSLAYMEQHLAVCQGVSMHTHSSHHNPHHTPHINAHTLPQHHYASPQAQTQSGLQSPTNALQYLINNPPPHSSHPLVLPEDKALLTDYFYHLIQQLQLCRFSESDRKTRGGKRENVKVGFGGLECRNCYKANPLSSRKFFWSNVDRLANSFAEIPSHVLKCRNCEDGVKEALLMLKKSHPEQMAKLPRGSQKVFFRRMWRRVHMDVAEEKEESKPVDEPQPEHEDSKKGKSKGILLSIPEDQDWLSDTDCFVRKNLEIFCAVDQDLSSAQSDRKYPICLGQVGIRCMHCNSSSSGARGNAVSFPYSIDGIYESVREFQKLHLESCPNLPTQIQSELKGLKTSTSLSSVLRRYYVLAAKALGMLDTTDGIRLGGEAVAIGSMQPKDEKISSGIKRESNSNQITPSFKRQRNLSAER